MDETLISLGNLENYTDDLDDDIKKNYALFASKQIVSNAILDDSADGTISQLKIVGNAHKSANLWDEIYPNITGQPQYKAVYVGNGTFTMHTDAPQNNKEAANLFFLAGNVTTGASTASNGVWKDHDITVTSVDGYVTICYRVADGMNPQDYHTQINKGTVVPYEPYGLILGEGKVVSSNKNRFDKTKVENGYLGADGQKASSSETYRISDYINVDDTSNITISGNAGVSEINCFYDSSKNFVSAFNMREDKTKTVDVPSNAKYIRSTIKATNIDTYQIEVGTSATDYVVGKTSSINAHSIVNNYYFLGINDVKDELIVLGDGTGYLEKRCGLNSDETEVIVLDNPQTIPLTPTQVQQLLALETFKAHTDIVSDCEIELGYYKDNENGQAVADIDSRYRALFDSIIDSLS